MSRAAIRREFEKHVVRGRSCSCPKHYNDGRPEFCEPGYLSLPEHEQREIADLRAGLASDDPGRAFSSRPEPYTARDGNPIDSW